MPQAAKVAKIRTAKLPVTEDSLAVVFANDHATDARYDHHTGKWYVWDGSRWKRNEEALTLEWARGICRHFAHMDNKISKSLGRASTIAGVERLARSDRRLAVTSEIFDRDPLLLGTPGGTVDLRDGSIRPAEQTDFLTKSTAVAPAPPGSEPSRWLRFLEEATGGDHDLIRFLKAVTGYCLTGLTTEHALFFVYGPGGNGKTVFLNTLSHIMGDYATTAPMDTFIAGGFASHPTELAMLRGARMVSASETEEGRAWAEGKIKSLTGGDEISARFMRQDFFSFRPLFKLLLIGNHKPVLRSVDKAARRRFRLIPFVVDPVEVDPELEMKLRDEAPAILRWGIEGCQDWMAEGLRAPEVVERVTDDYFAEQDLMAQWIGEQCECDRMPIRAATQTRHLSSKLFGSWAAWAKKNGEEPGSNKRFSQALERRGFTKKTGRFGKEFLGIKLRNPRASEEPK